MFILQKRPRTLLPWLGVVLLASHVLGSDALGYLTWSFLGASSQDDTLKTPSVTSVETPQHLTPGIAHAAATGANKEQEKIIDFFKMVMGGSERLSQGPYMATSIALQCHSRPRSSSGNGNHTLRLCDPRGTHR